MDSMGLYWGMMPRSFTSLGFCITSWPRKRSARPWNTASSPLCQLARFHGWLNQVICSVPLSSATLAVTMLSPFR